MYVATIHFAGQYSMQAVLKFPIIAGMGNPVVPRAVV